MPGHALGLFGRGFDRLDRLVEVDDDALAHSQGRRLAHADDLEPGGAVDRDDRAGLGRPDIEPANGLVLHPPRTPILRIAAQPRYIVVDSAESYYLGGAGDSQGLASTPASP